MGIWGVVISWWGSEGMNGDEGWSLELWWNDGELKDVEVVSKSSGILSVVRDDWGEFRRYWSIDKLAHWTSNSLVNFGSRTMSKNSLSDLVLNRERSKYSSKGRSSMNNHSTRKELDLKTGLGLTELSCLLIILGIRLGLSNKGGNSDQGWPWYNEFSLKPDFEFLWFILIFYEFWNNF